MRKTYQFKVKMSKSAKANAESWLYYCQQLYNMCIEQRIIAYKRSGTTLSAYSQSNQLPELKKACPEFKVVGSQALQDVVERVGKAFKGFFSRLKRPDMKAGFPRFKSIARYDSFTLKQAGWKFTSHRHLEIKNIGRMKLYKSCAIKGAIKTVTLKRDHCGDWFVSFSCDDVPPIDRPHPISEVVGIDVGLNHFCTDTEGHKIANPRYYRKAQKELRRKQRAVARKKKGSKNRKKAVKRLAKAHRKVSNMRKDFLHKAANHYINTYQTICVENLKVRNMVKNKHLSKSIADAAWSTFVEYLLYKAEEAGREVIKVDPRNTSQNCSGCGSKVKKSLATRIHQCPECELVLDRDKNAARNIAAKGRLVIDASRVGQTLASVVGENMSLTTEDSKALATT